MTVHAPESKKLDTDAKGSELLVVVPEA